MSGLCGLGYKRVRNSCVSDLDPIERMTGRNQRRLAKKAEKKAEKTRPVSVV